MITTEYELRRTIRRILLEINPIKHRKGVNQEKQGFASEDAWAQMYPEKAKGIKLSGSYPEFKRMFSRSKVIEEPSKEKKEKIFKELRLEKGVFDDSANAGKSDLQKVRSLYDSRKVQNPKSLEDIIRNYSMLIALFRKCDLNYLLATNKKQADKLKTKNYISNSKSLQIVANPFSFSNDSKPKKPTIDELDVFMKNKNVFFYGESAIGKKLVIINRLAANNTYVNFKITEISFNQSLSTKSFVEFLKQNNYVRIHFSNIAALKKEAIKTPDGEVAYE